MSRNWCACGSMLRGKDAKERGWCDIWRERGGGNRGRRRAPRPNHPESGREEKAK